MATRYSSAFTSFGTPTIMYDSFRDGARHVRHCPGGRRYESRATAYPNAQGRPSLGFPARGPALKPVGVPRGSIPHTSLLGLPMPPPLGIAFVLLFWVVTTGLVAYRDVWPRYFSSGPPPIVIDVADEAGQLASLRWLILRDGRKVGSLTTDMKYVEADDTFRFVHTYRQVTIHVMGVEVSTPELVETTRTTRTGDLRGQSLDGRIDAAVRTGGLDLALSARVKIRAGEGGPARRPRRGGRAGARRVRRAAGAGAGAVRPRAERAAAGEPAGERPARAGAGWWRR